MVWCGVQMLQEDDAGLLRALDVTAQQRERRRRWGPAPLAALPPALAACAAATGGPSPVTPASVASLPPALLC